MNAVAVRPPTRLADGTALRGGLVVVHEAWSGPVLSEVVWVERFRVTLSGPRPGSHWVVEATACHPDLEANLARTGFRPASPDEAARFAALRSAAR